MKIAVTIPAFNEEKTIANVISKVREVMDSNKYNYDVIVVDDGSKDKTTEIAKKNHAKVFFHPRNLGLAETFRTELEKCIAGNYDVIVHIDADGQYDASDIPRLINEVKKGHDLVLGSRFKGKIEQMPLTKRLGNIAFSKVISTITKMKITDAQTGFRAFTKDVAKITITSTHTYTQEQILRASRLKFSVKEIPTNFYKRHDKSRLISHPFEYAVRAWINIFRIYRDYEPLKFFGLFGGLFFLAGIVIGLWILWTLFMTGNVGALPRVLLTVLLISIGVQIWLFGFLADMMKK